MLQLCFWVIASPDLSVHMLYFKKGRMSYLFQ